MATGFCIKNCSPKETGLACTVSGNCWANWGSTRRNPAKPESLPQTLWQLPSGLPVAGSRSTLPVCHWLMACAGSITCWTSNLGWCWPAERFAVCRCSWRNKPSTKPSRCCARAAFTAASWCRATAARTYFTSEVFQTACLRHGSWVRCKVSQKGGMGVLERLNRTYKYSYAFRRDWNSLAEVQTALPDFHRWYNRQRLHSALNYDTPWATLTKAANPRIAA